MVNQTIKNLLPNPNLLGYSLDSTAQYKQKENNYIKLFIGKCHE